MKDLLLVDGNSLGFAAQAMTKLSHGEQETQAIYGTLRSVRTLLTDYPKHAGRELIVCWDGDSWRKRVSTDYKSNREDNPKMAAEREAYRKQRPLIARGLMLLGVRQDMASNLEADDIIAMNVAKLADHQRATIVSGDRDLLQLVSEQVDWLNPIRLPGGKAPKLLRVDHESFADMTGYEDPSSFLWGKILMGDNSDNLKGIDGIGEKAAPLVIKHWGNPVTAIARIRKNGESEIPDFLSRYRKKLLAMNSREAVERLSTNMRLMDLNHPDIPAPENYRSIRRRFDAKGFENFCEEMGFASILRNFNEWVAPFGNELMSSAA